MKTKTEDVVRRLPGRKADVCELCPKAPSAPSWHLPGWAERKQAGRPPLGISTGCRGGGGELPEDCCWCLPCPPHISPSCSSRQQHPYFPFGDPFFPTLTPRLQPSVCDLRCTKSLNTEINSGMDTCPCQFNRVYPKLLLELLGKRVSKQIVCKTRVLLFNFPRAQICLTVKPTQKGKCEG